MSFTVHETTEDLLPAWMQVLHNTFFGLPGFDLLFPRTNTSEGFNTAISLLREDYSSSSRARYIHVLDTATTTTSGAHPIAGVALYQIYDGSQARFTPADFKLGNAAWETKDDEEASRWAMGSFMEMRRRELNEKQGKMMLLEICAVAPEYQKQGVGRMLVGWGTEKADELGLPMCVESSKDGVRLYQSAGFVYLFYVELNWPEKWKDRGLVYWRWMVREATPKEAQDSKLA